MPKRNIKNLLLVADYLDQHPESYDQGTYGQHIDHEYEDPFATECGSKRCIAGTIVYLQHPILYMALVSPGSLPNGLPGEIYRAYASLLGLTDGQGVEWVSVAGALFGLDYQEASLLFSGSGEPRDPKMSVDQVLRMIALGVEVNKIWMAVAYRIPCLECGADMVREYSYEFELSANEGPFPFHDMNGNYRWRHLVPPYDIHQPRLY